MVLNQMKDVAGNPQYDEPDVYGSGPMPKIKTELTGININAAATTYYTIEVADPSGDHREGRDADWLSSVKHGLKAVASSIHGRVGILYAVIAALSISAYGTFIYITSKTMNPFQLCAMVIPIQMIGSAVLMLIHGVQPTTRLDHNLWIIPSGVLMAATNYLFAYSCRYMIMSDASAITQVSLILVGIMSFIILKEPYSLIDFSLAILAFVGVVFIARPTFIFGVDVTDPDGNEDVMIGTLLALGSALCKTPSYIFVRKQGIIGVHPFQSNFANAITKEITSIVICTVTGAWENPTLEEWLCALGAGVFYLIAHIMLYMALARETAPFVSIILTFEMIASFILQLILFGVVPGLTSWIGALLVLVACVSTAAIRHNAIPSD